MLSQENEPKTKREHFYLLHHYSAILCCTETQAKIALIGTKRVEPTGLYKTALGNEEVSGLSGK